MTDQGTHIFSEMVKGAPKLVGDFNGKVHGIRFVDY